MASTLGTRIREARLRKGITQTELAKLVDVPSHSVISDYERGKRGRKRPDIVFLLNVAKILDISPDWLFLGKESNNNK